MKSWIAASAALTLALAAGVSAGAQSGSAMMGGGSMAGGMGGGGMMGGRGGGAMHAACRTDAEHLCANIAPGGGRIAQCLRQHQDRVSAGCQSAMATMRSRRWGDQGGAPKTSQPAPPSPQ